MVASFAKQRVRRVGDDYPMPHEADSLALLDFSVHALRARSRARAA